jgi:hypothetical protein
MADEHTGLGKLITSDKGRDAVHVAIAPVTATEKLHPGQGIVLVDGDPNRVKACGPDEWAGIVDPFLTAPVFPDQRFWMWMRPGSITALRHEWTHPALDGDAKKQAAEAYIRKFADGVGDSYQTVIDGAAAYVASVERSPNGWDREYLKAHKYEGVDVPDEFWDHYEVITGKPVAPDSRGHFFDCMGCS